MKRYYFAYGMNTNLGEMSARCPQSVNIGHCTLTGFELKFRLHADIDRSEGHVMEGVLWEITPDCERALDRLEGYPFYYDKIEVVVNPTAPVDRMTHIVAMAYIMNTKGQEDAPGAGYKQCLIEGYTANGLNVDELTEKINSITIKEHA